MCSGCGTSTRDRLWIVRSTQSHSLHQPNHFFLTNFQFPILHAPRPALSGTVRLCSGGQGVGLTSDKLQRGSMQISIDFHCFVGNPNCAYSMFLSTPVPICPQLKRESDVVVVFNGWLRSVSNSHFPPSNFLSSSCIQTTAPTSVLHFAQVTQI